MRGRKASRRSHRVGSSGQRPLALEVDVVTSAEDVSHAAESCEPVKFLDPSPDRILAGTRVLGEFLVANKMGWVMEVRSLLRNMDWSSYKARYSSGGRPPFHPAAIVGLILLGHMTGRTSLRQMEEVASADVRAWWLTGGIMPDYSSLCRFINRHKDDLTAATFEALTRAILRAVGSRAETVFIDGTVVQAAASRWRLLSEEAAKQAADEARKATEATPEDSALAAKAELAAAVATTVHKRNSERVSKGRGRTAVIAPQEPEAVVQPLKEGGYAPSYKPSAAVNADRIVVANDVDASNEAVQVDGLLAQAERIAGTQIVTAALDAGYNTAEVLTAAERRGVDLLCPEGKTTRGDESWLQRRNHIGKDKFTYDAQRDCLICPAQRVLNRDYRCTPTNGDAPYVRYRAVDCSGCPLASKCLTKNSTRRSMSRYDHDVYKEALRQKMSQPEVRQRYKQRQATVEPVHGEQKHIQHMMRFRRRGLGQVRLEYSLHCMAHNIRRYRALRARPQGGGRSPRRRPFTTQLTRSIGAMHDAPSGIRSAIREIAS